MPAAPTLTWEQLGGYFAQVRPATYVLPMPEQGVVYVKNPKAACSTILLWLDRVHTGEADFAPASIHREHRLPRIGDVGRRRVLRMLSGEAYRFAFVRHPLRRLESVYRDKIISSPGWGARALPRLGWDRDRDEVPTFEQFLDAVERQDPLTEMDPHWRPQHLNLIHPLVTYDHVGRVETFEADVDRICEESGLLRLPTERRNASVVSTPDSVYDGRPDLVRRVEALFATDYELYGY